MKVVDWLTRTIVLILSALATLALIGSLASVSNTPLGEAFPGRIATPVPDAPESTSEPRGAGAPLPDQRVVAEDEPASQAEVRQAVAAAGRDANAEIARLLKALTYAVLALAGFAAAAMIALMRIAHHLGRIAER